MPTGHFRPGPKDNFLLKISFGIPQRRRASGLADCQLAILTLLAKQVL